MDNKVNIHYQKKTVILVNIYDELGFLYYYYYYHYLNLCALFIIDTYNIILNLFCQ